MATAPEEVGMTKVLAGAHWRPRIGVLLAVASFFIYSILVISLPQVRDTPYACEQSSFAAAVSNIVYGSRIGSMYTGVFDMFMTHFTEPLPQALEEIRAELPAQPPGDLSPTTLDGNGVGYPLVGAGCGDVDPDGSIHGGLPAPVPAHPCHPLFQRSHGHAVQRVDLGSYA